MESVMPRRVFVAVLWSILPILAACHSSLAGPSDVPLGKEFTLKAGETAAVSGTDLRVSFDRLVEDSRCPGDATCIRAGEAVVALTATWKDGRAPVQLRTVEGSDEATAGAYRVRLAGVEPYPFASKPTPPADYRVVLEVTR
jgi:hypothetical protein